MKWEEKFKILPHKTLKDRRCEDEAEHGVNSLMDKWTGIRRYGGDGPARFHREALGGVL